MSGGVGGVTGAIPSPRPDHVPNQGRSKPRSIGYADDALLLGNSNRMLGLSRPAYPSYVVTCCAPSPLHCSTYGRGGIQFSLPSDPVLLANLEKTDRERLVAVTRPDRIGRDDATAHGYVFDTAGTVRFPQGGPAWNVNRSCRADLAPRRPEIGSTAAVRSRRIVSMPASPGRGVARGPGARVACPARPEPSPAGARSLSSRRGVAGEIAPLLPSSP